MLSMAFVAPVAVNEHTSQLWTISQYRKDSICSQCFSPLPIASSNSLKKRHAFMSATQTDKRLQRSFPSLLRQFKSFTVNAQSGKKVPLWMSPVVDTKNIQTAVLPLPKGQVDHLPVVATRSAQANVLAKREVLNGDISKTTFVVFAHGFSQRPLNYFSLLSFLALNNCVVIAPRTWILSVFLSKVEVLEKDRSVPARLQAALLIDTARAVQVASSYSSRVHVLGHSMGAAVALVYAGYASSYLKSIVLMAPVVNNARLTELNQTVRLKAEDGVERMYTLASQMRCRTMILHGLRDKVVPTKSILKMFSAFSSAPLTGLLKLTRGSHVGFEDSLEVDIPFTDVEKKFFNILDRLIYGYFDIFRLDTREQLDSVKRVIKAWITYDSANDALLKEAVEASRRIPPGEYEWN